MTKRAKVVFRESDDPWRGVQPRYKNLVHRGPREFYLTTSLPSGKPIEVRLAPLGASQQPGTPR
jgi:hypothetical protein